MRGLTVVDFSQMMYLSVTTLRHYHQVGLLEPAEVNPDNGYRYYSQDQIPVVQVIRRLGDLGRLGREWEGTSSRCRRQVCRLYLRSLGGCFRNRG